MTSDVDRWPKTVKIIKGHAKRMEFSIIKQPDREKLERTDKDLSTVWVKSSCLIQSRLLHHMLQLWIFSFCTHGFYIIHNRIAGFDQTENANTRKELFDSYIKETIMK